MRRAVLLFVMVAAFGAASAEALTVREIIELSKTGLSDDVLLALIEIERRVFPVDPATLKALKDGGVSEKVILAMIRSGRTAPPELPSAPPAPATQEPPPPQVVVIDHHEPPAAIVREVAVAVPVYVPVYVRTPRHRGAAIVTPAAAVLPGSSIGLRHGRIGLSAPPPAPTSDPPYWRAVVPLPRRSDPPGWQKSPYLKP